MGKNIVLAYTTCPSKKNAEEIAELLISKKLVACANMFRIDSIYKWNGRVERAREYALILKTRASNFNSVKREIEKVHPYDVPCILKMEAEANKEYYRWLCSEIL
ncbi:MAG: divalent-cation tolerance protein CutA [Candidatus Woesearchaeota archaeon]